MPFIFDQITILNNKRLNFSSTKFINFNLFINSIMKQYLLKKKDFLGTCVKEIHYLFNTHETTHSKPFKRIIVHHTSNLNTIQKMIDTHVKKKKWAVIGFHFLIGTNGQIYQARDLKYAGAHAFGYNYDSIGIAIFGNLTLKRPTIKQVETLNKLIKLLKGRYPTLKDVLGHNQAIYLYLKKEFPKANLGNIDPLDIQDDLKYYQFMREVQKKIFIHYSGHEAETLVGRLRTCPGIYMYEYLKKIRQI